MACSPSFVEHVLDLLSSVGPVDARRMFGGHGVYARGVMFCLLDDDELYLRTDDETRGRFVEAGCRMWVYPRLGETNYYRPPDEAHEDAEAMAPWARLGLEAALRRRAAKVAKTAGAAARRAARARRAKAPAPRKPAKGQRKRGPATRRGRSR